MHNVRLLHLFAKVSNKAISVDNFTASSVINDVQ
jgi:hypothetical protein